MGIRLLYTAEVVLDTPPKRLEHRGHDISRNSAYTDIYNYLRQN
jgi:hypothetical protein